MKDWFKARNIWGAAIAALSDDEAGKLAKAIWSYTMTGGTPDIDGAGKGILAMIVMTLKQDEERDSEISEKRSMATAGIRKQKASSGINDNQMISSDNKSDQVISNDDNKNKNKNKSKNKEQDVVRRFTPPTPEEVAEYCRERGNNVNADRFVDFYSSKGWKVGNQPMKDWKAAVRTWEGKDKPVNATTAQGYKQRDYSSEQEDAFRRMMDMEVS